MSIIQRNPLNLTRERSGKAGLDDNKRLVNTETTKYFIPITLGTKYDIKFIVPLISLFMDSKYCESFLDYTKDSDDKNILRLREILSDDKKRKKNFLLMVEKIGDILIKYNEKVLDLLPITYTEENYKDGGKRIRYYLNTDGIEYNKRGVVDLTKYYKIVKQLRKNANIVSEESQKSENEKAL